MINKQKAFTLLEILITLAILAFSLTALVNLQMKLHMSEVESYQRGQAVVVLQELMDRLNSAGYVMEDGTPMPSSTLTPVYIHPYVTDIGTAGDGDGTKDPIKSGGTYDPGASTCAATFTNPATQVIDRAKCELTNMLKGASEVDSGGTQVGGMINAMACIEQTQDANWNTCTPGNYRVTVVWQGLHETVSPEVGCGENLFGNGASVGASGEGFRRAITGIVTLGLPRCTN